LNAFLDSLVQNLITSCEHHFNKFVHTLEHIISDCPDTDNIIFGKGVFPYEYFDSLDKFKDTSLPPKDAFYNNLKEEWTSDDDYKRAQRIWSKFGCQNFKDYHDFYLKTDVLLLADVFEQFRKTGMENFHLDPALHLTLPSYSWDACLMMTDVKLELICEPEKYLMFESNIRGGVSTISHRYARSNIPGTTKFNPQKDPAHILIFMCMRIICTAEP